MDNSTRLKGIVNEVIFRNAENGYTVVDMDCDGILETAVGIFPPVSEGEQLVMEGSYKFHNKFGRQFVVTSVRVSPPNTEENIIKYLSSGIFAGVGIKTAQRIVERFGTNTLDVIATKPHEVSKIKSITAQRALSMQKVYNDNRDMQETLFELSSYEITVNLAIKIYKKYRNTTMFVLKNNPYKMVADIDGVGFLTADKIALNIGLSSDCAFRIKAGIIYTLNENATKNGNTYMKEDELTKAVIKLLGFGEDRISQVGDALNDMMLMDEVKIISKEGLNAVMPSKFYNMERSIAQRIKMLSEQNVESVDSIETLISQYEKLCSITLHEVQKEAVKTALSSGVCVITGGPGTGKTTIIRCIVSVIKALGLNFSLCAPTGRAAKRMSEATGEIAKTVHRLLDLNYKGDEYAAAFTYDEYTNLPVDYVIIDEASMCDEFLFISLIKAVRKGSKFIIVGDVDQLPSVGAGNVLSDLIYSNAIPVVKLTQIYRQDDMSLIVTNAHRINHGEMPIIDNKKQDFFFIEKNTPESVVSEVIELVSSRLPKFADCLPSDIQVLAPMKKGVSGVKALNVELQRALNNKSYGAGITVGENTFNVGDKVIHTVNNYSLEWTKNAGMLTEENGVGIFNGDIGFVSAVNKASLTITVKFEDGREAIYSGDILDQLSLAYAISVHKSQGSEFGVVVFVLMSGSNMILTRNLLYTAVTRAKNMVVLVGDKNALVKMVTNNYCRKRYTMLIDFLVSPEV